MKKFMMGLIIAMMMCVSAAACPLWECNYDVDDYSCGCSSSYSSTSSYSYSSSYEYNEYSTTRQPIYCQYCGHEQWDCVCGTYNNSYSYDYEESYNCNTGCIDYDYDYDCNYNGNNYSYSGGGSYQMDHWANVRDCNGNIIGVVGQGSNIQIIGVDSNDSSRVMIYDCSTGTYGSVLASCVYGGYEYSGSSSSDYSYVNNQSYSSGYNYNYDYDYDCNSGCIDYDYQECNYGGGSCNDYVDYVYEDCGYQVGCIDYDYGYNNYSGGCSYDYSNVCGGYNVGCINAYSNAYIVQVCETIVQRCVTYNYGGGFGYSCGIKNWC